MDQQFQLGLLCYLVQSQNGKHYVETILDESLFDPMEFKLTVQVLRRYFKKENRLPGELEAREFLEDQIASTKDMSDKLAKYLREVFEDIYYPLEKRDMQFIEDKLIASVQDKQIEILSTRHAKGEITSKEFVDKLRPVASLALPGGEEQFAGGGLLFEDNDKFKDERIEGNPTFLQDLNLLTAAHGFYAPQLIVVMSGPKHFKTGTLLSIALGYARDGLNVYIADIENGTRAVRNRLKMGVLQCELHELFDGTIEPWEVESTFKAIKQYGGGDIFVDNYPAYSSSMEDVKNRLSHLKETRGFEPDLIIFEPLDKFGPIEKDDRRRDTRIKIQIVYAEAMNLLKELNVFGFTPSQVNRAAVAKKVLDMGDIAEDFAKVANAHAVFAICATDDEMEEDELGMTTRRIIPVAQREGVAYRGKNQCLIKVDEKKMIVAEAELLENSKDLKDD